MYIQLKNRYNKLSGVYKHVISGAFWSLLGTSLAKAVVLCATVMVARILSQEEYGEVGMIRSTIGLFMAFSGFSIGATASKYIAENREKDDEYVLRVYTLSLLFSLTMAIIFGSAVLLLSNTIALNSFHAPHLVDTVRIAAIILIFATLSGSQSGVLSGFEDFKSISTCNMLFGFFESVFIISGAKIGGVNGTILGFGLANMINFVLLYFFASRHIRKIESYSLKKYISKIRWKEDLSIFYKFSIPATISSIMVMVFVWYSKTMLVRGCGFEAMATFDIAEQWRTQLLFIPAAISQIALPLLSNTKESGDQFKIIKINIAINAITTISFVVIFILFGRFIMSMYSEEYVNTTPLYLMSVTGVIISITNILGSVCFANDKAWNICMLNGLQGVVLIICAKYFINRGLAETGLALANVISYIVFVFVLSLFVIRIFRKK